MSFAAILTITLRIDLLLHIFLTSCRMKAMSGDLESSR